MATIYPQTPRNLHHALHVVGKHVLALIVAGEE
jgi:hypothetical protein